ncbi:MAG: hypothetical protein DRI86_00875 [Bacteroidetes bacterium]|nr:MAG: hypothetical protein DRI86_00875 [Bacteroidota bacterium]
MKQLLNLLPVSDYAVEFNIPLSTVYKKIDKKELDIAIINNKKFIITEQLKEPSDTSINNDTLIETLQAELEHNKNTVNSLISNMSSSSSTSTPLDTNSIIKSLTSIIESMLGSNIPMEKETKKKWKVIHSDKQKGAQ